jgi:plastocyanin
MNTQSKLWIFGLLLIIAAVAVACGDTTVNVSPASQPTAVPAPAPASVAPQPTPSTAPAPAAAPAPLPVASGSQPRLEVASDIVDFTLEELTVEVGTHVIWTNQDGAPHTSTSGSQGTKTGIWDGPPLAQGTSFGFTFQEVGTFQYFCAIHPTSMNSTITVVAEGALGASTTPKPAVVEVQPTTTPAPIMVLPGALNPTDALLSPIIDFTLENLTIEVGETITWENQDTARHTSTSGVSPDTDGIWDSSAFNRGEQFSFTFEEPGEFPYWCTIHPFMTATITVTGGASGSRAIATPTPMPTTPVPPTPMPPTPMPPTPMPPTPVPPTATPAPAAGNIVNSPIFNFTLENLSVTVGTTIIWENQDAPPHTSTSGVSPNKDGI